MQSLNRTLFARFPSRASVYATSTHMIFAEAGEPCCRDFARLLD